jgi:hypothetical protein
MAGGICWTGMDFVTWPRNGWWHLLDWSGFHEMAKEWLLAFSALEWIS